MLQAKAELCPILPSENKKFYWFISMELDYNHYLFIYISAQFPQNYIYNYTKHYYSQNKNPSSGLDDFVLDIK